MPQVGLVHVEIGLLSTVHVELQPSPSTVLPSSHPSTPAATSPSPQVDVHVSAVVAFPPSHRHPHSSLQSAEQPSPESRFPSSHQSSCAIIGIVMPSPHLSKHVDMPHVGLVHSYVDSTVHAEPQPSPFTRLPSSHPSQPATSPSPQVVSRLHVSAVVAFPPSHRHPHSTVQSAEQPSKGRRFPSSHSSDPILVP